MIYRDQTIEWVIVSPKYDFLILILYSTTRYFNVISLHEEKTLLEQPFEKTSEAVRYFTELQVNPVLDMIELQLEDYQRNNLREHLL